MRGTRVPAIVPSDFRPGTEGVGRLGPSCARTSTTTRNRESAPARTELGGHAGSLRMPTAAAAAARYRRASTGASPQAAHHGSLPRQLAATCDAGAPRYARVRSWRSREATGTPRKTCASGHEKMPSTCQRLRVDQLLERTWVSSNDQAPGNAPVQLQRIPIRVRAQRAQSIAPLAAATPVGLRPRSAPTRIQPGLTLPHLSGAARRRPTSRAADEVAIRHPTAFDRSCPGTLLHAIGSSTLPLSH
jgi:hypothetical protein